jgi:hypothetical protein
LIDSGRRHEQVELEGIDTIIGGRRGWSDMSLEPIEVGQIAWIDLVHLSKDRTELPY